MVRILILGTGGMAEQHVKLFRADPEARIVACADVDEGRAMAFATKHDIPHAFAGLEAAIAWGAFDAASNVTPDNVHHPTTLKLIAAGKHVLCEKPLAETYQLAREMADAAQRAGIVDRVNLSYRNVAALAQAKAMIAAGEIGEVRHVEASYRQSWLVGSHWGDWRTDPKWLWRLSEKHGSKGVLGDVGIHILDFTTHAIGAMPVTLQSRLQTFHKAPGDRIGAYPLDANDSATMQVSFANGALGVIHASRFMTGYGNVLRLHVFGDKGAVEIEHGLEWTELRACTGADVHNQAWRRVVAAPVPTIHQGFLAAIRGEPDVGPDFEHATALQRVLDQCFTVAAQGAVSLA